MSVQSFYHCNTCGYSSKPVCASCAATCHAGHDLGEEREALVHCHCGRDHLCDSLATSRAAAAATAAATAAAPVSSPFPTFVVLLSMIVFGACCCCFRRRRRRRCYRCQYFACFGSHVPICTGCGCLAG